MAGQRRLRDEIALTPDPGADDDRDTGHADEPGPPGADRNGAGKIRVILHRRRVTCPQHLRGHRWALHRPVCTRLELVASVARGDHRSIVALTIRSFLRSRANKAAQKGSFSVTFRIQWHPSGVGGATQLCRRAPRHYCLGLSLSPGRCGTRPSTAPLSVSAVPIRSIRFSGLRTLSSMTTTSPRSRAGSNGDATTTTTIGQRGLSPVPGASWVRRVLFGSSLECGPLGAVPLLSRQHCEGHQQRQQHDAASG
jgi:hypothetical protein